MPTPSIVPKRTLQDIVSELDSEKSKFFCILMVVGFEESTSFIAGDDGNKLEKLADLVNQGGEPIGLIALTKYKDGDGPTQGIVYCRAFREYAAEGWVHGYLSQLIERAFAGILPETQMETIRYSDGWLN